jgi:undecaprenyl-diphosphatase
VAASKASYGVSAIMARTGDGIVWVIVGLTALWLAPRTARVALYQTALAVGLTALFVTAVKLAVRRERPHGVESARWSATPRYDRFSFPSGHAARAAAIVSTLAGLGPSIWPMLLAWLLLVGTARVAVGAHYVLDVVCGIALGALTALLVSVSWPWVLRIF